MAQAKQDMGSGSVKKLMLQLMIPAVVAQVVNLLYNIVDRIYIGHIAGIGAAALTGVGLFTPILMLLNAFAMLVGAGGAPRTAIALGQGDKEQAEKIISNSFTMLLLFSVVLTVVFYAGAPTLLRLFGASDATLPYALAYSRIYILGSVFVLLVLGMNPFITTQGFAKTSMLTTVIGAVINIILDPILIFGLGPVPRMGIAGAAAATVAGQCVAAVLTGAAAFRRPPKARVMWKYVRQIYRLGYPSIFMQMLYTVYIMALNMILAGFSDDAVTVLGLYYKLQSFFFIPLNGLQTCIVPILSYNFACLAYDRCKRILYDSCGISLVFMLVGVVSFECIPDRLIGLFSQEPAGPSLLLSVVRQICCLIPLFWLFSKISLGATWFAYPLSEVITGSLGVAFYLRQLQRWKREAPVAGPTVR